MNCETERVEVNTPAGRPKKHDHSANRRLLAERFRFIGEDVRNTFLNIIEANARHWYLLGGGNVADFEKYFNQEKHAEE